MIYCEHAITRRRFILHDHRREKSSTQEAQKALMIRLNSCSFLCLFCGLTRQAVDGLDDPERDCGNQSGGGDGKNPGPDDSSGDAPFYC